MLKKTVWFWNLVHYNIFIWENRVTNFIIFPFYKLLGTNYVKKMYAKRGVSNPDEIVKDALTSSNVGSNIVKAGGVMGALLLFICISIFQYYTGFFEKEINTNPIQLFIYGLIIIPINYFSLFKNRRYLIYFKEFDSLSKRDKTKYSWFSFVFVLVI